MTAANGSYSYLNLSLYLPQSPLPQQENKSLSFDEELLLYIQNNDDSIEVQQKPLPSAMLQQQLKRKKMVWIEPVDDILRKLGNEKKACTKGLAIPKTWQEIADQINEEFSLHLSKESYEGRFRKLNRKVIEGSITPEERIRMKELLQTGDYFKIYKGLNGGREGVAYSKLAKDVGNRYAGIIRREMRGKECQKDPYFQEIVRLEDERIAAEKLKRPLFKKI